MIEVWERYYTPELVAKFMVSLLHIEPRSVVDICVGSWNLLNEARKKWNYIEIQGVDTNPLSGLRNITDKNFHHMDGREFALKCIGENNFFPLVLANPPFGKESYQDYSKFAELPGYSDMSSRALNRIETTMLLANLSLLEDEGYLVAIVPRTLVNGEWLKCLRQYIARNFKLELIINLPNNVFNRDISTSILVVSNKIPKINSNVKVYQANFRGKAIVKRFESSLGYSQIVEGLWDNKRHAPEKNSSIRLFRGAMDSSLLSDIGKQAVIHSTDIEDLRKGAWHPTKFTSNNLSLKIHRSAQKGDIVMIRVGRNCGTVARLNVDGPLPVSDCVLVIRHSNPEYQDGLWQILNCNLFIDELDKLKRGIGANYLTQCAVEKYLAEKMNKWSILISDTMNDIIL